MFAAGGVFLIGLFYGAIGLGLLRALFRWYTATVSAEKKKFGIRAILWSVLLVGLIWRQQYLFKVAEDEYIGTYPLTNYPSCPTCVLYLQPDNHYEVRQDATVKEEGPWRYEAGGDYWIVYINEMGQLGSGKYEYDFPKSRSGFNSNR
jgi:hypothetical protein